MHIELNVGIWELPYQNQTTVAETLLEKKHGVSKVKDPSIICEYIFPIFR